ncbi:MAG: CvpA family protein [Candidatus Omnitrophota bacterium]
MEWFWKMYDHLQKSVAGSALQNFAPTDWIFLCLIFWGLVQGSRKGFSDMFGKLLGIFLVSMLTLSFYLKAGAFLNANLPVFPLKVAESISFFLLTLFLWLSVSWSLNIVGKFLRVEAQGILKTLGGMIFGVLRMMLLLSFLAQMLLFLPIEPLQQIFKQGRTFTGYAIAQFVPHLHTLVVSPFRKPALKKAVASYKVGG